MQGTEKITIASYSGIRAVVCWTVGAGTRLCRLIALDGNTITYPEGPLAFGGGSTSYNSMVALSDTYALLCYNQADSSLNCQSIKRAGNSLTLGPIATVQPNSRIWISVTKKDPLRAMVCAVQAGTALVCNQLELRNDGSLHVGGNFPLSSALTGASPSYVNLAPVAGTAVPSCFLVLCLKGANNHATCLIIGGRTNGARSGEQCHYTLPGYVCGSVKCNSGVWSTATQCVGPPTPTPRPTATPTPPPNPPDPLDGGPLFPDGDVDDQTDKEEKENHSAPGDGASWAIITSDDMSVVAKLMVVPLVSVVIVYLWWQIFPSPCRRNFLPHRSVVGLMKSCPKSGKGA